MRFIGFAAPNPRSQLVTLTGEKQKRRRVGAGAPLNRIDSCFTGSNSGYTLDGTDEDFAIPDLVRLGALNDGIYRVLYAIVFQHNLKLYLGEKINSVLASTINLGVAL
ncbi:uncharacterized protein METZ01_LOCUS447371, partial [marine metagenome]